MSVAIGREYDDVAVTIPELSIDKPGPILMPPNTLADAVGTAPNLLLNVVQSVELK